MASAGKPVRHQSPPSAVSAMPATQSKGGCQQVLCLPRKEPRRERRMVSGFTITQWDLGRAVVRMHGYLMIINYSFVW